MFTVYVNDVPLASFPTREEAVARAYQESEPSRCAGRACSTDALEILRSGNGIYSGSLFIQVKRT